MIEYIFMFMKFNLEIQKETKNILDKALDNPLSVEDANYLMNVQGQDFFALLATADKVREELVGNRVTFINNCNIV